MKYVCMALLSVVLVAGCQGPSARLNAPPQGYSTTPSALQQPFKTMVDNAALADMALADMHFAGTTTELNGAGLVQMQRMVKALKTYGGGEVRYTTDIRDQKLVQARINRMEDYLATAGIDMNKVTVRSAMPASDGMSAADAIKAQQAPTADSKKGGGSKDLSSLTGGKGGSDNGNGGMAQ